jgi:hypothetical protein
MAQISRSDFRNGLFTLLEAQRVATPTLLRKVERRKPGSFKEKPIAWIGSVVERLSYDPSTRLHIFLAEIVIVSSYPSDDITTADPFDALEDALVTRFNDSTSTFIANTILELTAVADDDIEERGVDVSTFYRGLQLTAQLRVWEGRG